MNVNKAREYFSAYHEGSLDRGLCQSFERAMREDAQLQAEYRAFDRTMEELSKLSAVTVEPPDDLHEMIAARLDRQIWETKQTQKSGMAGWWRTLAIGAAAVAVLAIALFQANRNNDPNKSQAGVIPELPVTPKSHVDISASTKGVTLTYVSAKDQTIVFNDADGKELERIMLKTNDRVMNKELANQGEHAMLISIKIGDELPIWVALPGSAKGEFTNGSGTLKQMIQGIADSYQMPVVLNTDQADAAVTWEPKEDALATVSQLPESLKLKPELRQSLLWIQKH